MNARGGGKLGFLIALAIVGAFIYAVVKVAPHYVKGYEFEQAIREEVKFVTVHRRNAEQMRDQLAKKAKSIDLPVTKEQIKVSQEDVANVKISVKYTVPVDLFGYLLNLNFDFSADSKTVY